MKGTENKGRLVRDFLAEVLKDSKADLLFFLSHISLNAVMDKQKGELFARSMLALKDGDMGMSGQVSLAKRLSH